MSEFAFFRIVVVDRIKQILIKIHPLFKCKFFAEYTWGDVACNQSSFNRNSTRTTHWVNKVTFAFPTCHQNHAGSQNFVEGCFYSFLTIATAVQRFSRTIQRECTTVFCNVDIQKYIRICDADRRAFACLFAEIIHDGILHFVGNKFGVTEFIGENNCIYRKTLGIVQIVFPIDGLNVVVDFIRVVCLEMLDRFQDADSCSQAEICLIHHGLVARKSNHTIADFNIAGS